MESFLTEDFLLHSKAARVLYHEYAAAMPIYDYHGHLPVRDIAIDRRYDNLTQVWLHGDHYKWRAMRHIGIPEDFCGGAADDEDKFIKWAQTVPQTLRNPLYHWSHLELKRYFGVHELLNESSARRIYRHCNERLHTAAYSARGLLLQMRVKCLCTTEDPNDTLEHHRRLDQEDIGIKILPAWRPDRSLMVDNLRGWNLWVDALAHSSGTDIGSYPRFIEALRRRQEYFHQQGCRISDHAMEHVSMEPYTEKEVAGIFLRLRHHQLLPPADLEKFKSALFYELALMNAEKGWVQQFHLGALRNVNTRMFERLGPDSGYDGIAESGYIHSLARLLDRLDQQDHLAKTIVYNLNPRDNEAVAVLLGCFQDSGTPGKLQYGPAWWFLDQKDGIEQHLRVLSNMSLLSQFVGMITDSRSFLSFPRHEYFRRILCNLLGNEVENGELPWDKALLGQMIQNICFYNAVRYFAIPLEKQLHLNSSRSVVPV